MFKEYLIEAKRPQVFDSLVKQLGQAQLVRNQNGFKKQDGKFILRVYADQNYIEFSIKNQRLCKSITPIV